VIVPEDQPLAGDRQEGPERAASPRSSRTGTIDIMTEEQAKKVRDAEAGGDLQDSESAAGATVERFLLAGLNTLKGHRL